MIYEAHMNEQPADQNATPEVDPEIIKHKTLKKELLTIFATFVVMLVIVGVLEYLERTSGFVTKMSEQIVNKII